MASRQRAFSFLPINERQNKPRDRGLTEMRGPYYDPPGKCQLADIYETCGEYVDILKLRGGFIERVLELEAMRAGVRGTNDLFGRVRTWKG